MHINSDLSENIEYNNPLFPTYIKKRFLSLYPNYSAVSHWHDDLEFIVILNGEMTYNVNGEVIELKKGNGLIVNSRHLHYGYSSSHCECEFLCVLLHSSLLCANEWFSSKYVIPFIYNNSIPYILLKGENLWQNAIMNLIKELYDNRKIKMAPSFIQCHFHKIFEYLYSNVTILETTSIRSFEQLNTLKDMIGFIQKYYREKITLEQISQSGNCCKSKCSSLFKQYLKQSPNKYLIEYRLNKSIDFLLNTDKTITEIAYDIGFQGASYYCEAFRKHFQISPKEYRSKNI